MLSRLTNLRNAAALVIALSFALALPAGAQSANRKGLAAFDATHEITLQGTIKEVVTHPPAGSPLGMHLTVATTTGNQDVHIGSYLPKHVTENLLHANAQVIVVGGYVTLAGKNILLARQLVVGGQTVTVRNEHGFLIMPKTENTNHHAPKTPIAGGAQ
jgi:hypothetical protein